MERNHNRNKSMLVISALLGWLITSLPFVFLIPHQMREIPYISLYRLVTPTTMWCIIIVIFRWLAPKYISNHAYKSFFLLNTLIVVILSVLNTLLYFHLLHQGDSLDAAESVYTIKRVLLLFVFKYIVLFSLSVAIGTMLHMTFRWHQAEQEKKAAQILQTKAELHNIRAKANPHFLLNTLNNIYSLISVNPEEAQKVVSTFSNYLRKILYGKNEDFVYVEEAVNLLKDYLQLMRIRLQPHVKLTTDFQISEDCKAKIAPYIIDPLIGNAFKHGISPTEPSFIHISIMATNEHISISVSNSNFPKSDHERNGYGIGLEQVERLLEINYPGTHKWTRNTDINNNIYTSKIEIYDTKLCHH